MNRRKFLLLLYVTTLLILTLLGFAGDISQESFERATKYFTISEIETGKNFFRFSLFPWTLYRIVVITILFYMISSMRYKRIIQWIEGKVKNSFLRLLLSTLLLYAFIRLLKFPFHVIAGFLRDRIFQMTDIDFMTWFIRHWASSAISLILVSLFLSLILIIINKTKKYIFTVPVTFAVIALSLSVLYPRIITPLFYETGKVEDPALKGKIMDLVERAGIREAEIHLLYKSRYRMTANAYFTGTGPRREIYLYDTLLKKFDHDEIITILAHELVHYNEEHVLIGIILGAAGFFLLLPLLNFAAVFLFDRDIKWFTLPEGLPALIFTLTIILYFIKPIENSISRIIEKRADTQSFELIEKREVFIEMEKKLAVINRSNILPNPFFAFFYYTHPPVLDRITNAEKHESGKKN
jgi:STE24 endopeptidase